MLRFFHALARGLYRVRILLWLALAISIPGFLISLFVGDGAGSESYLLGAVLTAMWAVSALWVANVFIAPPPVAAPDAGARVRLRVWLKRAVLWMAALLISGVSAALLLLSVRAIVIVLRG